MEGEERGLLIAAAAAGRLAGDLHFTRAGLPFIHLSRRGAHASDDSVDSSALRRLDRLEDIQRTLILEMGTCKIFSLLK